jgi:hypothetical protein
MIVFQMIPFSVAGEILLRREVYQWVDMGSYNKKAAF